MIKALYLNMSNVTNMSSMFEDANSFNQTIKAWTSSVLDMSSMFEGASSFNQNIKVWDVTNVTTCLRCLKGN